jgi:hypothetical protein
MSRLICSDVILSNRIVSCLDELVCVQPKAVIQLTCTLDLLHFDIVLGLRLM